jgi:hypothetical protein
VWDKANVEATPEQATPSNTDPPASILKAHPRIGELFLMKNILVVTVFMLASVAWAAAQQPGSAPDQGTGQTTSPSSQAAAASQSQSTPNGDQNQARGSAANAPVTEGCLGGKDPHYTITDKAGTTYKLNIPATADTSKLASHVGEPVQVLGSVKDADAGSASINVQSIGRGTGNCPASGSKGMSSPK